MGRQVTPNYLLSFWDGPHSAAGGPPCTRPSPGTSGGIECRQPNRSLPFAFEERTSSPGRERFLKPHPCCSPTLAPTAFKNSTGALTRHLTLRVLCRTKAVVAHERGGRCLYGAMPVGCARSDRDVHRGRRSLWRAVGRGAGRVGIAPGGRKLRCVSEKDRWRAGACAALAVGESPATFAAQHCPLLSSAETAPV